MSSPLGGVVTNGWLAVQPSGVQHGDFDGAIVPWLPTTMQLLCHLSSLHLPFEARADEVDHSVAADPVHCVHARPQGREHQLDLADACHLLMQRPQPSCYDLASRTQFIAGQPVVLQPTPEGLVKGDELSPKMQAAGAAGGCCIDGLMQSATQSRCGDFSADAGGRASQGQTNPILLWVDLLVALLI